MSAMSTARVESPGGKISPMDRMEEERKRRAEIAASAAERYSSACYVSCQHQSYNIKYIHHSLYCINNSSPINIKGFSKF